MTDHLRESLQSTLGAGYRVERELGGGGMSRVFVARDLSLDRDVVVKVLPGESTAGVNADRFRREIQVIARLQHPHIIPILAAGVAEGSLYYLMPFMGGETLRARLSREGPMSASDTARILREVLDALAFAHKHGVIHRDIKPENVLLEAGHAVVADFGIAKALRESGNMTSAGISLGTPAYAAPEQAMADPTADHRADLYSVGAMAYEMLTGTPVFGGSVQQVVAAHLTTPPTPIKERRSDVSQPLADVIMRALAKEPTERPQSADEMHAALDAAVTPVATTPLPTVVTAKASRARVYTAVAGIAVLLVAGFFALRNRIPRAAVIEGAEVIAVLPLGAVSDSSLVRLGQDLVVTLTSNLDGVGSLRTTDAVTVLTNAKKLTQPIALADALQLGRKLGVQSVLTGTLIAEGDKVRASVALYRVRGDSAIAKATVVASPTAIAALTDSITWQVLRQVWRRGAAPSPVLTGLTTSSFDALRAFLDGEHQWQLLQVSNAEALFRHAFELDTSFAQAYLRFDYLTSWHGAPPDTMVRRHLLELTPRLPERERGWVETRELRLVTPKQIAAWKAFAARYPDYPPALMSAADGIIHSGPLYGISMSDSRAYIDRLVELAPDNADALMHQAFVAITGGRVEDTRASLRKLEKQTGDVGYTQDVWTWIFPKGDSAHPFTAARADSLMRFAISRPGVRDQGPWAGQFGFQLPRTEREALYRHFRSTGILQGDLSQRAVLGEGIVLVSNGYWMDGIRLLQRAETADLSIGMRMSSARVAALGAWMGAVEPAVADSVLARIRAMPKADSLLTDRIELRWTDGLIGLTRGDAARVQRVLRELTADTGRVARATTRTLSALWLERSSPDAAADSLRAVSDDVMENGGLLMPAAAVGRFVVGRALRRRGTPALADKYLMWSEGYTTTPRNATTHYALYSLVAYERGVAQDEAGDKTGAVWHLQQFVDRYTNPPDAHRPLIEDAKKRLKRLTADAAK